MDKQRADPAPMRPARELVAMVKRLPKEERLRVEGVIAGMELARTAPTSSPAPPSGATQ